jgi:hypothetical protein
LDFLLGRNGKIAVVEVKSGDSWKALLLEKAKKLWPDRIGECFVLSPSMSGVPEGIRALPLYMAMFF